ncbi:MAG: TGS domain-containing protein, partial [Clostridia bacterium]|nr:TGS domain-containing protein [Clostridia bacterium]
MMKIKLRDSVKEFDSGTGLFEVASSISEGLARVALCAKVNGKTVDMGTKLFDDAEVEFLTFADEEGKKAYRHTAAHIMAQAVKRIYPTTKVAIGPAIANGFYYDFDFKTPLPKDALAGIEAEMKKIIKENISIVRQVVSKKEALAFMKEFDEKYKIELINDLPESEEISFYRQGDFVDLCAGPHVPSTGYIKAYKLTAITGAYWRGDEKNKMLTRIYGTAFDKKQDMLDYLEAVEEAKKRDHN